MAVPSPQLAAGYPVPINWFLVDAPLQNLKPDDAHWRLRLSLDGAASLLQQEDPLWLAPLDPGSNALGLELLDGNGTPLGAPFNSLMQELRCRLAAWRRQQCLKTNCSRKNWKHC